MIQKLRWQFVSIMMTIIVIMLVIIFTSMFASSRAQFRQSSMERLRSVIKDDLQDKIPPPHRRLGAPTLVISVGKSGVPIVIKNQFSDLEEDKITGLIAYVNAQEEDTGFIHDDNIRYLREHKKDGKIRYAFMDCTIEQNSLRFQIYHSVMIGLVTFVLLLFAIIRISHWVVRPVARAWEQQRRFVADASHELKTPLTVILSNTSMLLDNPDLSGEKAEKRLHHIQAEAVRMKALIDNLLQLARTDSNAERPIFQPVDFSHLVQEAVLTFEPVFYEDGKCLADQIEEDIIVIGSDVRLRQLIDILLDNAFKYSIPKGHTEITLKRFSHKEVFLTVRNDGVPIPPDKCPRLFERFYRIDQSRSTIAGYGLGLSIAQIITEECGGEIRASSDGISQNTFSVKLPCAE